VSQQNFDAQWISTQAKDAMNAVGVGAFFNLLNFGQMYSYHVLLLPAAIVALVVGHVLLVRKHGVVPPFALGDKLAAIGAPAVDGSRAQVPAITPLSVEPFVAQPAATPDGEPPSRPDPSS
jgi:quinol-cytochrome oxidoreductase complex cytochrome b subunit